MRTLSAFVLSLILAAPLLAQRGGGMSPDDSFNRLLAGYGGTGDVVDYSKVSPESRERYNRFAQMTNTEPMPLSGTITRAQYGEAFNKRMEAMRAGGGFGGMGGNRGGDRGAPAPAPTVTVTAGVSAAPQTPQERTVSDEEVGRWMRRFDKNDDGRVSAQEAESTDKLRTVFSHYDANRDGSIDLAELKVYMTDRENKRTPDAVAQTPQQQPYAGGQGYYSYDQGQGRRDTVVPEEPKPVVFRYGKLPMKELPSWFESLDTDKDGQIGLYEWRNAKKATAEFTVMDLNSDGLLTAEEYLRWKKGPTSTASASAPSAMTALTGKDAKEGKDSKESRKDKDKGSGGISSWRDKK